jgi:fructose-1,6-bisphosphatase
MVDMRSEGFGLEWWDECTVGHLKVHDRVLELNRIDVFKITNKVWDDVRHKLSDPVQAVFMRTKEHQEDSYSETLERIRMTGLRSNIAQIQKKLEQKFIESKRTSKELERAIKERVRLKKKNIRLLHRVAFLEDHTKEVKVGMTQVEK